MPTKFPQAKPIEQAPRRSEEKPKTFPKGRVCTRPGCKTVLSIYTRGPRCNPCIHDSRADRLLGSYCLKDLMEEAA